MGLVRCPDCNRDVSDQAWSCPGCARPLRAMPHQGYQHPPVVVAKRAGVPYEAIGAVMVILGIIVGAYGCAGGGGSGVTTVGFIVSGGGFFVFLVGRFK